MHESMTSFIVLACILPVIVLTLYILKKTMNMRLTGNQHIKIINQVSVGAKERLLLLQIDKDVILVGVTPHQISTLHVMTESVVISDSHVIPNEVRDFPQHGRY